MNEKKQNTTDKKQQVQEAIRAIQNITRQRELLNNEMNEYFNELKVLGFPKKIVSSTIKKRQQTRFQVEADKILTEELEDLLGD